jgi:hypothetical protein
MPCRRDIDPDSSGIDAALAERLRELLAAHVHALHDASILQVDVLSEIELVAAKDMGLEPV